MEREGGERGRDHLGQIIAGRPPREHESEQITIHTCPARTPEPPTPDTQASRSIKWSIKGVEGPAVSLKPRVKVQAHLSSEAPRYSSV